MTEHQAQLLLAAVAGGLFGSAVTLSAWLRWLGPAEPQPEAVARVVAVLRRCGLRDRGLAMPMDLIARAVLMAVRR